MDTQKFAVPLAIVVAGLLIAGALYFSSTKQPAPVAQPTTTSTGLEGVRSVTTADHILGNPNAELVIVEYSDTECPFCKQFHVTMHQVMTEYGPTGKVAWVYRHFPIDQLHPKARREAQATECANELGGPEKFWSYLDMVYQTTTSNNTLDPAQLPIIAKNVGLNVDAFNTCLNSGKYAAKVQTDYENAVKAGGQGTPYSIVITKKDGSKVPINGAEPFESVKGTIDLLLKN